MAKQKVCVWAVMYRDGSFARIGPMWDHSTALSHAAPTEGRLRVVPGLFVYDDGKRVKRKKFRH